MTDEPVETISLQQMQLAAKQADTDVVPMPKARTVALMHAANLVQIGPSGPSLGRRFSLDRATVSLGRDSTCSLRLTDNSISRIHAQIEHRADGGYRLIDLNSRNGCYVNGARVTRADLKDGDYLQMGECVFRFLAGGNVESSYHDEIHRLTLLDALTGVHNRRSLSDFLDSQLDPATGGSRRLAVLLIDVDHFKSVNDRHGHPGGDAVLRGLAARLRNLARAEDLVARYGGEEFAVALPNADLENAVLAGDRFRRAMAVAPFDCAGQPIELTVSVGAAAYDPGSAITPTELLQLADTRLYEAKRCGRNRIVPPAPLDSHLACIETPPPLGATREIHL